MDGPEKAYVVSSQGGTPRPLLPEDNGTETGPSWSPDGRKIIFATSLPGGKESTLRILDLASHQITTVPGSAGRFSAHWSPDGQMIIATSLDSSNLYLFNVRTERWSTLYSGLFAYATWSRDGDFIYFLRFASDQSILRIPVTSGAPQLVVDLKDIHYTGTSGLWFGLDPTDAPLLLRDVGISDVYALTLGEK